MNKPPENDSKPVEFGPYRLLNLLGQGGMGRVYRALRHDENGVDETIAVKVLDRRVTAIPDQVRALMDEARLGRLLRHPNIVATHELKKVGETFCIAMEFVDGWPLDRLIRVHREREQPIPLVAALSLMIEICEGLAFAHKLKDDNGEPLELVHRDLKPANVIVGRKGEVKLMDFGTAKSRTNLYQTEDGQTRGTPRYMSPEQVMGYDIDQRSDIFALGSILHEVVMLEHCFKGDHLVSVMRRVVDREIGTAQEDVARAAAALEPIFSRCIQQDPDKRFASVGQLEKELRKLRGTRPPGPAVADWIRSMEVHFPESAPGEFGGIGVPGATKSLPLSAMETLGPNQDGSKPNLLGSETELPAPSKPYSLHSDQSPASVNDPTMGWDSESAERDGEDTVETPPQEAPLWTSESIERRQRNRRVVRRAMRVSLTAFVLILVLPYVPGAIGEKSAHIRERLWRGAQELAGLVGMPIGAEGDDGDGLQDTEQKQGARPALPASHLDIPVEIRGAQLILGSEGAGLPAPSPQAVTIPQFEIMAREVTVAQLEAFCSDEAAPAPCQGWGGKQDWQEEDHPAVTVPWKLSVAFCNGWQGRLPTEAEWELAARSEAGWTYPWGNQFRKGAVNYCDLGCDTTYLPVTYEDDGFVRTGAVGSLPRGRSPQSVFDLSGNVSEWTLDCWTEDHSQRTGWKPQRGPCPERVIRGGSWRDPHSAQASWHRAPLRAERAETHVGFRCVKGAEPYAKASTIRE